MPKVNKMFVKENERRLQWLDHVEKSVERGNRWKRIRGRPKSRWVDVVIGDLGEFEEEQSNRNMTKVDKIS